MLDHRAENAFQRGVELIYNNRWREALPFLRAAIDFERQGGDPTEVQARYLSYYGLCLAMSEHRAHEAMRFCRLAADRESYRADMWWNLARVALGAGKRSEAFRALHRGRSVDPTHRGIDVELKRMGVRRTPVVTFLPRENPINVFLGRMRA
jgi:predicted Zn-dependent protease